MSEPRHDFGSGPIEEGYRKQMNDIAQFMDGFFNGDLHGEARHTGFVLLIFPFGEKGGRCNYISNGANRRDIIKLLREQANRFDEGTQ